MPKEPKNLTQTRIPWENYIQTVADLLGMETSELTKETDIYNSIGIDSLGVMSLGLKLQQEFKKRVPLSAASTINTLGDMFEVLNQSEDGE